MSSGVKRFQLGRFDLSFIKAALCNNGGRGLALAADAQWLQMAVPPEELPYLRARRDVGRFEMPQNWCSRDRLFKAVARTKTKAALLLGQ